MLIADAAEDGRPRIPVQRARPATPAERAAAARLVAAEDLRGPLLCRACALDVLERMVQVAVEGAEEDLRARIEEQTRWPN